MVSVDRKMWGSDSSVIADGQSTQHNLNLKYSLVLRDWIDSVPYQCGDTFVWKRSAIVKYEGESNEKP